MSRSRYVTNYSDRNHGQNSDRKPGKPIIRKKKYCFKCREEVFFRLEGKDWVLYDADGEKHECKI